MRGGQIRVTESLHDALGQFWSVGSAVLRVSSFHGSVEVGAAFFAGIGPFPSQEASKLGVVSHPPMSLAEELARFHDGLEIVGTRVAHHGVHTRVLL